MQIVHAPRASTILYSLLVNREDKLPWLLPANICPIVPIAFFKAETPFAFADISAETLHMDLEQVEGQIKMRKFGGLLYAHTYGEASSPDAFFEHVKSLNPGLLVVDDRCLCIPAFDVRSSADVVLFSTGYAKVVDLNCGGYAFIKDDVAYQPVKLHFDKQHLGDVEKSYKKAVQNRARYDYRDCDWLETDAPLSRWVDYRSQIESGLKASLAHRRQLNGIYASRLPFEMQLPNGYQMWRFNIRVNAQQRVLKAIFNARLFASSHYIPLTGIMADGSAPVAESLAGEVINLFNDYHFDEQKAEQICDVILENHEG